MRKLLLLLLCVATPSFASDKPLGRDPATGLVNPRVSMGFKSLGLERTAHSTMGSTETFNVADGNYHTGTLDANLTVTLSGWQTTGNKSWLELNLVQNGTGKFTVTFPGAVVSTIPISPYANSITNILLWTSDGGTTVYGKSDAGGGIVTVSKSADYTTTASDANGAILHPTSDNNSRTFTIDSNANVPYPYGTSGSTTITFINQINTVTIAITSDTMTLQGANTTGSRTLAAGNTCTAVKVASTSWIITGSSGLTIFFSPENFWVLLNPIWFSSRV